jgi:hypothetical protein
VLSKCANIENKLLKVLNVLKTRKTNHPIKERAGNKWNFENCKKYANFICLEKIISKTKKFYILGARKMGNFLNNDYKRFLQ